MAVSKLCCPFCWIFLQILRGDECNFSVRGHHSTLYAVDLPGRLPESLTQKLVTQLRGYVGQQLKDMVLPQPTFKKHGRNPSMGSDGDPSVTSSEEEDVSKVVSATRTMQGDLKRVGHFFVFFRGCFPCLRYTSLGRSDF